MAIADGLVTWVHLICSSIWVGGSIFIAAVAVPVLRAHVQSLDERDELLLLDERCVESLSARLITRRSHQLRDELVSRQGREARRTG